MSPEGTGHSSDGASTVSRRSVLRAAGVTIAGAGLVGSASTVSAGDKGGCDDPPKGYPRVTTRDHFDTTWYGSVYLTDGNDGTNYGTAGDPIPGVDAPAADELLVYVHGWTNDDDGAVCSVAESDATFSSEGYDHPVVGFSWDADVGWYTGTEIAERNGPKLAQFTADFREANPGVPVRYVAHSLGARVVLEAVRALDEWGRHDDVATLSILGGAADDETVSIDGAYGSSIERATGRTDNFWMDDDEVLNWAYGAAEWDSAIGNAGCEGTPPGNYRDHDVGYVPDHFSYNDDAEGCIGDVVSTF